MHDGHRERMRERIIKGGLDKLQPHEVLEYLLYYAIPRKDTNPIGHALMDAFGSLSAVFDADVADLMNVAGMTEAAAVLIHSFPALFKEYNSDLLRLKTSLPTPAAAVKYLQILFAGKRVECIYLICLDNKSNVLNCCLVSSGTANAVNLFVREISEIALKNKATAVILAHNHPSGNCRPSTADIELTRAIALSLRVLEIKLNDHYILTADDFFSFRTEGLIELVDGNVSKFLKDTLRY